MYDIALPQYDKALPGWPHVVNEVYPKPTKSVGNKCRRMSSKCLVKCSKSVVKDYSKTCRQMYRKSVKSVGKP